jgi:hypothetical protein
MIRMISPFTSRSLLQSGVSALAEELISVHFLCWLALLIYASPAAIHILLISCSVLNDRSSPMVP